MTPVTTLRCPRCAFTWPEPEPHWDEFGSCASCGLLLAIEGESLRSVTEDDLDALSIEDSHRLERHAAIWVARRLHEEGQCPACGRTGAFEMSGSPGAPDMLRAWRALERDGQSHARLGPCIHCGTPLAVARATSGRLELDSADVIEPAEP
jgi:hypothetical protein